MCSFACLVNLSKKGDIWFQCSFFFFNAVSFSRILLNIHNKTVLIVELEALWKCKSEFFSFSFSLQFLKKYKFLTNCSEIKAKDNHPGLLCVIASDRILEFCTCSHKYFYCFWKVDENHVKQTFLGRRAVSYVLFSFFRSWESDLKGTFNWWIGLCFGPSRGLE